MNMCYMCQKEYESVNYQLQHYLATIDLRSKLFSIFGLAQVMPINTKKALEKLIKAIKKILKMVYACIFFCTFRYKKNRRYGVYNHSLCILPMHQLDAFNEIILLHKKGIFNFF